MTMFVTQMSTRPYPQQRVEIATVEDIDHRETTHNKTYCGFVQKHILRQYPVATSKRELGVAIGIFS